MFSVAYASPSSLIKQVINDKYPVEDLYIKVIRD